MCSTCSANTRFAEHFFIICNRLIFKIREIIKPKRRFSRIERRFIFAKRQFGRIKRRFVCEKKGSLSFFSYLCSPYNTFLV